MSTLTRDAGQSDAAISGHPSVNFLKGMVRQQWASKLENSVADKQLSRQIVAGIERHISNMNGIVDQLDYELFCIPNIISHSKHMSEEELYRYLGLMESVAVGYSSMHGRHITSLLMVGLTAKAKNPAGIGKYYRAVSNKVESKLQAYNSILEKRKVRIGRLSILAKRNGSGIFRIFRRKRVAAINQRIDLGMRRMESLNSKVGAITDTQRSMKLRAGVL